MGDSPLFPGEAEDFLITPRTTAEVHDKNTCSTIQDLLSNNNKNYDNAILID